MFIHASRVPGVQGGDEFELFRELGGQGLRHGFISPEPGPTGRVPGGFGGSHQEN